MSLFPRCLYIAKLCVPEALSIDPTRHREKTIEAGRNQKTRRIFQADLPESAAAGKGAAAQGRLAEVYVGDEFLGIVFKDEDDGDYNFSMAILDIDLA